MVLDVGWRLFDIIESTNCSDEIGQLELPRFPFGGMRLCLGVHLSVLLILWKGGHELDLDRA